MSDHFKIAVIINISPAKKFSIYGGLGFSSKTSEVQCVWRFVSAGLVAIYKAWITILFTLEAEVSFRM